MKKIMGLAVMAALSLAAWESPRPDGFPVLTGPYLGQTPPGNMPVIFAPGIVSTGLYTRDVAISKSVNKFNKLGQDNMAAPQVSTI